MMTMPASLHRFPRIRLQQGAITLVVSLSILMLGALVAFTVSDVVLMEQKIANNAARAKQAFEAAEAGLATAVNYLSDDPDRDGDGRIDPVFDVDGDGLGDLNTAEIDRGRTVVSAIDATGGELTTIAIEARGSSDDGSVNRRLSQTLARVHPLPNAPALPLIVKGETRIVGIANLRNPQGHNAIWGGGPIDLGAESATATEIPLSAHADYPRCLSFPMTCVLVAASSGLGPGLDLIEDDPNLAALGPEEFFANFFGANPSRYRSANVSVDARSINADASVHLATREVIWLEGDAAFTGITAGCSSAPAGNALCPETMPAIVIVDGNATLDGGPRFYGLLHVAGNLEIRGNAVIYGALIIGGDLEIASAGSLDLWFHSEMLTATALAGPAVPSAGAWKDF